MYLLCVSVLYVYMLCVYVLCVSVLCVSVNVDSGFSTFVTVTYDDGINILFPSQADDVLTDSLLVKDRYCSPASSKLLIPMGGKL